MAPGLSLLCLLLPLPPPSTPQVVDVGGGTGFCTLGIVKSVDPANVTLMDQSPHQLAKARAKPALQGVTIVEVGLFGKGGGGQGVGPQGRRGR
jgi:16S rRNA G1207 methylase RsmC